MSSKWLLPCSYNPNTNLVVADHLHCIGRRIDFYSSKYDDFIILSDLNTELSNSFLEQFCESYNFKSLIEEPTCFKKVYNPSCTDLRGMGAHFLKKKGILFACNPKQMSFLTIFNENIFLKIQGTRLGAIVSHPTKV